MGWKNVVHKKIECKCPRCGHIEERPVYHVNNAQTAIMWTCPQCDIGWYVEAWPPAVPPDRSSMLMITKAQYDDIIARLERLEAQLVISGEGRMTVEIDAGQEPPVLPEGYAWVDMTTYGTPHGRRKYLRVRL